MIANFVKKISLIIIGIIYAVLGIIFIWKAVKIINILIILLGIAFIVFGLIEFYKSFIEKSSIVMAFSILLFCAGIYFLIRPSHIKDFIGFSIGVSLVLQGAVYLKKTFEMKKNGVRFWYLIFIPAILIIFAGVYGMFNPNGIVGIIGVIAIILGLGFIISGIGKMISS